MFNGISLGKSSYLRDFKILLGILLTSLVFLLFAVAMDLCLFAYEWIAKAETWHLNLELAGFGLLAVISSSSALFLWKKLSQALWVQEQIKAKLKEDEAKYRHLFENLSDAVLLLDAGTGIVHDANLQAERLLGRAREEIIGAHQNDLHLPLGTDQYGQQMAHPFAAGCALEREYQILRKDGTLIPVRVNTASLTLGGQRFLLGLLQDLSACKRAGEALRESEERFRNTFEQAAVGIAHLSPEGRFIRINAKSCEMLGYERREMLERCLQDITNGGGDKDFEHIQQLLAGRVPTYSKQRQYVRKDGSSMWGNLTLSVAREPAGAMKYLIAVIADITDVIEAKAELKKSEERYRQVVDNAAEAIVVAQDGVLRFVNAKALELSGYSEQELIDTPFLEFVHPDNRDRVWHNHMMILTGERPRETYQFRINNRRGSPRWVEASAVRMAWEGRPATLGFLTDITERKSLEQRYLHAQKMEAVGRLAAGVAHDFNNLMGVVCGYADLVLAALQEQDPAWARVEKIKKAARRAALLTSQLLAFSRKQILQPEVLNFNTVIDDMETVLHNAMGKSIELVTHFHPDLPNVKADVTQMEQVVMNLATNARDAMPEGGKFIIETSLVELDESYAWQHGEEIAPGPYVLLALSDTGIGMDIETQAHIFEPFFTTKEIGTSTGLGLASAYGTVRQNGGHIWAYSEPGQGSSFKIYLPVSTENGKRMLPINSGMGQLSGEETILVVEDDEMLRKLATTILKGFGYRTLEAADGEAALQLSGSFTGPIHLLLSDVIMPGINGPNLASRLQAEREEVRVLYMSGYSELSMLGKGLLESGVALIEKPFTIESLGRKVREILDASDNAP